MSAKMLPFIDVFKKKLKISERKKKDLYLKMLTFLAIDTKKSIKVLYPFQSDKNLLLLNEIGILKKLNDKFHDPVLYGVVKFIAGGYATWKHEDDEKSLPDSCLVVVYTYGAPLFPLLRQCVQSDDRKMVYWVFHRMVSGKTNVFT